MTANASAVGSKENVLSALNTMQHDIKAVEAREGSGDIDPNEVLLIIGDFQFKTRMKSDDLPRDLKNFWGTARFMIDESRKGNTRMGTVRKIETRRLLIAVNSARIEIQARM